MGIPSEPVQTGEKIGRLSQLVIVLGFVLIFAAIIGFFQSTAVVPFFGKESDWSNFMSFLLGSILIKINTPKVSKYPAKKTMTR